MSRAVPRYRRTNASGTAVGPGQITTLYKIIGQIENQMTVTGIAYTAPVASLTNLQLGTLLLNLGAVWVPLIRACVSGDWSVTSERIDVTSVNNVAGKSSILNAGLTGQRGAGHLPNQMSAVIIKNSALKGQHGRGRVSLPAIQVTDVTASTITALAEITALTNFSNQLSATVSDGVNTHTPIIAQRAAASPKLVTNFSVVTSGSPKLLLGTTRRRKIGRGK